MITVLVGPQASGKSTYASDQALKGALIVSDDAVYSMLHGNHYDLWSKDLIPTYKAIEMSIITTAILSGRDVIIDRPNTQKATRQRYVGIARAFDQFCKAVVFKFEKPEVHAMRRWTKDHRGLSLDTWQRACERVIQAYQPVTFDEGFFEIENR